MKTNPLFKKYPYLPLCIDVAKNYDKLSNSVYFAKSPINFPNENFTIEKIAIKDNYTKKRVNTPVRVSHKTGDVQINDNLQNMNFSTKLFFLVWCFNKIESFDKDGVACLNFDLDTDKKTYSLLENITDFSLVDAKDGIIDVYMHNPNTSNNERIAYLISQCEIINCKNKKTE